MPLKLASVVLVLVGAVGCSAGVIESYGPGGRSPGPGGPGGPGPEIPGGPGPEGPGYSLSIDTSTTNPYGTYDASTLPVTGTAMGSLGPVRVERDAESTPMALPTSAAGAFTTSAAMEPGLNYIELRALDSEDHRVDGNRSLLRANYLPEGDMNSLAAAIAVSPALLGAIAGGGDIASLDASAFITPGTPLPAGPCNLVVDDVAHSPPELSISINAAGELVATVTIRDLTVGIHGTCNVDIPVLGGLSATILPGSQLNETTVTITVTLAATPVPEGECLAGFTATGVAVAIPEIDLDLSITTPSIPSEVCITSFGPCFSTARLVGEAAGELAEGLVAGLLEDQLEPIVRDEVGGLLSGFGGLEEETMLDFFDTPITLGICLTGLESVDGQLMAFVGATATSGAMGGAAPGAPLLPTVQEGASANTLYLDPGLVGQLIFSAYQGGGLELEDITAGSSTFSARILAALASGVRDVPGIDLDAPLRIDVSAQLAPIVTAAPAGLPETDPAAAADLEIGLGELELSISAGGVPLFVFGTHVEVDVALEPTATGVAAVVLPDTSTAEVWIIDSNVELSSRERASLPSTIRTLLLAQLPELLAGTEIALPDIGTPLIPADVFPTPGGYLEIPLAP